MRSLSARSFKVRHGMRKDMEMNVEGRRESMYLWQSNVSLCQERLFSRKVCRELKGSDKAETNRDGIYMASSVRGIPVVSIDHHPL